MFTLSEVAERTKVSERVLLCEIERGKLHGARVGREWRFSMLDLEDYLEPHRARELFDLKEGRPYTTIQPKGEPMLHTGV